VAQFDYLGMQGIADKLIKKFGMAAALRRASDDRPCQVVIVDYLPREQPTALRELTDRRVIVSAVGLTEAPDKELDQLVTYIQPPSTPPVVDQVLPLTSAPKQYAPAGIVVAYEFTIRG
jgi:hypothetical protein